MKTRLPLRAVYIQDADVGGYTAYFAEFPEAISEGANKEEAKKNLFEALLIVLDTKREIARGEALISELTSEEEFEFELAGA